MKTSAIRWLASAIAVVAIALPLFLSTGGSSDEPAEATKQAEFKTKATPAQDRAGKRHLAAQKRRAAKQARYLASPGAVSEREKSKTAFKDQPAKEAAKTFTEQHPKTAQSATWRPPTLRKGERPVAFLSPFTQRIDIPGSKGDAIVEAQGEPIATKRGERFVAFDLQLEREGNSWTPGTTDLKTKFPADLSSPISAPLGGDLETFEIRPAEGSAAGQLIDNRKVFYANAATDTDVIAEPTPRGGEVSWVVRSPESPETFTLDIEVDGDDAEVQVKDGSAFVVKDGTALANVAPPRAFDAQGRTVPAEYVLKDDQLQVSTPHRSGDFAYPIVVDPYYVLFGTPAFRDTNDSLNMPLNCVFSTWTDNTIRNSMWVGYEWFGCRHYSQWANATKGGPWHSKWVYDAPNASTIIRSEWGALNTGSNGANRSDVILGIANGPLTAWEGYYAIANNLSNATWTVCATPSCTLAGSVDNRVQLVHRITLPSGVALPSGQSPWLNHIGTNTFFSDYDTPTLNGVPAQSNNWLNTPQPTLSAYDGGTGLSTPRPGYNAGAAISVKTDGVTSFANGPDCWGGVQSPCPTSYAAVVPLHEGRRTFEFSATDIIGRSVTHQRQLKIDRSGPEIDIGGRFGAFALDQASMGWGEPRTVVNNSNYVIRAIDGRRKNAQTGADAPISERRSGVKSIAATIYGATAEGNINTADPKGPANQASNSAADCDTNNNPSTAQDSCQLSLTGSFAAGSLAPGIYYFRVQATDWINNTTLKDFKVAVGVGSVEQVTEGRATSRYLPLQIKRNAGVTSTNATIQVRSSVKYKWCDVPAGALKEESSVSTPATVPLDFQSNSLTRVVVLDLNAVKVSDKTGGPSPCSSGDPAPKDGTVYVRALLQGSGTAAERSSEDVAVRLERGGLGTDTHTQRIGPGTVDLATGNYSMSSTDVNVDAYKANLTVTRTYNSRYSSGYSKIGPLGAGWTLGVTAEAEDTPFAKVEDYASIDLPEEERIGAVAAHTIDGGFVIFELKEDGSYAPDVGFEDLELRRVPDAADSNRTAGFTIYDQESGLATSFARRGSDTPVSEYPVSDTYLTGNQEQVTYAFAYSPKVGNYPTYAFAPAAGITCGATETSDALAKYNALQPGCQALKFNYQDVGTFGPRLISVDLKTVNPTTQAMTVQEVARYEYDTNARLIAQWDPRISPALKTTYTPVSTTDSRIASMKPAGEEPFTFNHIKLAEDPRDGRLQSVSRPTLLAAPNNVSTINLRYNVPVEGSGAPFNFSAAETLKWGQERPAFLATAVFPPDQLPSGDPATNYDRSTLNYMNPLGQLVNTREPGGAITAAEYDKYGAVTRELGADNLARALTKPTAAERLEAAEKWDTKYFYETVPNSPDERRHQVREIGPEHEVRLANGNLVQARKQITYCYDENRSESEVTSESYGDVCKSTKLPVDSESNEPFDLVTSTRTAALVGAAADGSGGTTHDVRTSASYFGSTQAELRLRLTRLQVEDPGNGKLNIKNKVDFNADGLETARYQPSSQSESATTTTRTTYYKSESGECGNRPEWRGLVCKVSPGGQPNAAGLPRLPEKTFTYNILRKPATITDTVVDSAGVTKTRTTEYTYDAAGRELTRSVTGGEGQAVKTTRQVYSPTLGRRVQTQSLNADGTVAKAITRSYDALGRHINYADAEGNSSAVLEYDLLSRPRVVNDGKASRTFSYDPTTGLVTGIADSGLAIYGTFSASYDADKRIVAETLPAGLTKAHVYDTAGNPKRLTYTRTQDCSSGCVWMTNTADFNIHGQMVKQNGLPTQAGSSANQEYSFDQAGRLSEVRDVSAGQCTVRQYGLDSNSNRTQMKTFAPGSGGACDTSGTPALKNSTFDSDRITDSGYTYDAFGQTTSVPQDDAGGTGTMAISYYTNGIARSVTQNGLTQTFEIDPNMRMSKKIKTGTSNTTETYAYADDSDSPVWIQTNAQTWVRYVKGIDGSVAAIQPSSGDSRWTINNLRGDMVAEANASGFLGTAREVNEFGVVKNGLPSSRPYGFEGGSQREALTAGGTVAMGARLYIPRTGRFAQTDPVLGGTESPYGYPSDPINSTDGDGHFQAFRWAMGSSATAMAIRVLAFIAANHSAKLILGDCIKFAVRVGKTPLTLAAAKFLCVAFRVFGAAKAATELKELYKAKSKSPYGTVILRAGVGTKGPWYHWYPNYTGETSFRWG